MKAVRLWTASKSWTNSPPTRPSNRHSLAFTPSSSRVRPEGHLVDSNDPVSPKAKRHLTSGRWRASLQFIVQSRSQPLGELQRRSEKANHVAARNTSCCGRAFTGG